ncbi:MAG TPA: hypothetical protein VEV19_09290 [Ktedonobacteraceae bacterium]|nr:hypothetical protein [Ktedonobacteraceae bacterium]
MNGETFSVLVWCWNDVQTHNTMIRVLRIDTGEHVQLKSGSFLLRISTDENAEVVRCLVRHLTSGNEVYVQSGSALQTFILSSLLDGDDTFQPPESDTRAQ